jgi:formylglycine-generating enzyme required for sulfatase activity
MLLLFFYTSMSFGSSHPILETVVIPGGTYWVGCDTARDKKCDHTEKPGVEVKVTTYRISKYEVTQSEFKKCVDAKICVAPSLNFDPIHKPKLPVTMVNWSQADQFCRWVGLKLPSEIQWEVAARGKDHRTYPWGDIEPDCKTSNSSYKCDSFIKNVGSFKKDMSAFGVFDMGGNVEEWIDTWYSKDYYARLPEAMQNADFSHELKSIRGGSYRSDDWHSRITFRFYDRIDQAAKERGFRCAN